PAGPPEAGGPPQAARPIAAAMATHLRLFIFVSSKDLEAYYETTCNMGAVRENKGSSPFSSGRREPKPTSTPYTYR
ncbi:MAG: hypothetical protein O2992_14500, partial [Gemmatimonadetes bacterium]|nr:hypothetical protein [Gemmatimonadota bacterium]